MASDFGYYKKKKIKNGRQTPVRAAFVMILKRIQNGGIWRTNEITMNQRNDISRCLTFSFIHRAIQ